MSSASEKRQPFMAHVYELRNRLFWAVLAVLGGAALGFYIQDVLLTWLVAPLHQTLYYSTPGGGFNFLIQMCLLFGVTIALPIVFYQIIQFIAPVFPEKSSKPLLIYLASSCLLVLAGVAFAYFVSLPAALSFLNEYSNDQVQSLISTNSYLSFVTLYLAGFAILFQLPLTLLVINRVTPLTPKSLWKKESWVILIAFIVAAVLTPTQDPINMAIMAIPIILLYNLSILMIWAMNRNRSPLPKELRGKRLVLMQPAVRESQEGHLCQWEASRWALSSSKATSFLHDGNHTIVNSYK